MLLNLVRRSPASDESIVDRTFEIIRPGSCPTLSLRAPARSPNSKELNLILTTTRMPWSQPATDPPLKRRHRLDQLSNRRPEN